MKKEEIFNTITLSHHRFYWNYFINNGDIAYVIKKTDGEYLMVGDTVLSKLYDGIYTKIICDYNLPLELPQVERYEPAGDGQSPLATVESFVNIKIANNLSWKRETNTMPQWGGSCWYYLRFMDVENEKQLVNSEIEQYWGSVDSYVWGAEHAVLHLLYARFWHKFLFDIGVVSTDEPFYRLRNQGMILWTSYKDNKWRLIATDLVEEKDWKFIHIETKEELTQLPAKMSKSLKNVINPDEVVNEYGADTLRLYEMYMGDFKDTKPWDTKAIVGVRRFLEKVWRIFEGAGVQTDDVESAMKTLHKTIKKVWEDIEEYRFNTAIAQMMICVNTGLPKDEKLALEWKNSFLRILHPFAPHIAEELWEKTGNKKSIYNSDWPLYDTKLVVDSEVKIGVQINWKVRGDLLVWVQEQQDSVMAKVTANPEINKWIEWKEIVKIIFITWRILNIVVK
jgi:leucyl-tRNA synthetase